MKRRSVLLICILAAIPFVSGVANAGPPSVEDLREGETILIRTVMLGYTITTKEYLFSADKVSIKEGDKTLGEVTLTQEDKEQFDRFMALIENKQDDHDDGSLSIEITHKRGGKVVGTHSCRWASDLRETKKMYLGSEGLRARLERQDDRSVVLRAFG